MHSMPLLIESVVSAALSRVAVMPDGVTFAEVSPDICFRLNPHRHCGIVLLPPMGFAIVTPVVCMLAAGSGDNLAVLPRRRSGFGWRCCAAFCWRRCFFCCLNTTMTFINRWLKGRYGPLLPVDRRVTAGALIPGVGGILAPLKGAAPHLRHPDHRPVFLGHAGAARGTMPITTTAARCGCCAS